VTPTRSCDPGTITRTSTPAECQPTTALSAPASTSATTLGACAESTCKASGFRRAIAAPSPSGWDVRRRLSHTSRRVQRFRTAVADNSHGPVAQPWSKTSPHSWRRALPRSEIDDSVKQLGSPDIEGIASARYTAGATGQTQHARRRSHQRHSSHVPWCYSVWGCVLKGRLLRRNSVRHT
jgi:hypothetical protein